ncbi:PA2169 family four-helix-bundle protein [Mucilaginibacter sp. CSA2-8R]|uniref:ferritin-like domain-containing protein n=1 Tax=Mucilaginibacter sp. CSA2-8R TaxID=3141542 RepID=UPI00315CA150
MLTKEAAEQLNHLIIIANDGKIGYAQAADNVNSSMLKAIFVRLSGERAEFADQLRSLVVAGGAEPEHGSGPVGTLHRVWIDIKTAFVTNDNHSVLKECIKGDHAAESAYETALKEPSLTSEERNVVEQQLKLTRDALFALQQELTQVID